MIERVKITCSCGREFRGFPEYKWNSRIKNKQPEDCNICTNKKIFFGAKISPVKNPQKITSKATVNKLVAKKKSNARKKPAKKDNIDKTLDNAWSLLVKLLAGHKCEYCGNTRSLNSHHVFSRAKKSVRWRTVNGVCLCVGHHIGSTFSAHKTSSTFTLWLIKKRGEAWHDELTIAANSIGKYTRFEKDIMLKELKKEIKCLQ